MKLTKRGNHETMEITRKRSPMQNIYSKPCLLKANPIVVQEFYKKRLVEPKTHRGYSYLCTVCCSFVPLNRDGETCITKHGQLLMKIYEHELESVKLSSANDRSRLVRKNSLTGFGLENKTIERSVSSSSVKRSMIGEQKSKMPRIDEITAA